MSNANSLNLNYVYQSFQQSFKEDNDVVIEAYIDGYNELVKFLNLIGSVFSFVSSDVKSKIKVMEKLREGDNSVNYASFRKMMSYEKENKLHEKNGFVSGSRTMLRLHRGLDFIRLFLRRISESEESSSTLVISQQAYGETLAEFHPWYIRKAATLAMHALPSRPELLKKELDLNDSKVFRGVTVDSKLPHIIADRRRLSPAAYAVKKIRSLTDVETIFGTEESLAAAIIALPQALESCDEVYSRVDQLYTEYEFHSLP